MSAERVELRVELAEADVRRIAELAAKRAVELLDERRTDGGWMSVRAAADHVGLSEAALRHLIARRDVPVARPSGVGGRILVNRRALDEWLDAHSDRRSPR